MVIKNITLKRKSLALKKPFITALRRVEHVEFIRVSVTTTCNNIAIGEAPATKAITGEDLETISHTITHIIAPMLQGLHVKEAIKVLPLTCKGNTSAKAALDMALFNLLYPLKEPITLQSDITISLNSPSKMLDDALEAFKAGCTQLKVKVGANDNDDYKRISSIAKALPDATLLIDANQAWSTTKAIEIVKKLTCKNIALIEQPTPAKDLEALKRIKAHSNIPILADESAFTLEDVQYIITHQIADMINIKLMKCGGMSEAINIVEYCKKAGVTCMMGSMLEGPYSIAAAMRLCAKYPDVIRYIDLDSPLLYKEGKQNLIKSKNSTIALSL